MVQLTTQYVDHATRRNNCRIVRKILARTSIGRRTELHLKGTYPEWVTGSERVLQDGVYLGLSTDYDCYGNQQVPQPRFGFRGVDGQTISLLVATDEIDGFETSGDTLVIQAHVSNDTFLFDTRTHTGTEREGNRIDKLLKGVGK